MRSTVAVRPMSVIRCRCGSVFASTKPGEIVDQAFAAGWQLRPASGRGSRSVPDLCPNCKPKEK